MQVRYTFVSLKPGLVKLGKIEEYDPVQVIVFMFGVLYCRAATVPRGTKSEYRTVIR